MTHRVAAAVLAALMTASCSSAPARRGAAPAPGNGVRLSVPFFPDRGDQCGPSALAGVLRFWGRPEDPAALREDLYRPDLKGSLTIDLMLAARARGLEAEMVDGDMTLLKKELDAGRPLLVFVNRGFASMPVNHFMVVTGYDDRGIYANTGPTRDAHLSYRAFQREWDKTDRWALVVSRGSKS